jgi:hypothetical protein
MLRLALLVVNLFVFLGSLTTTVVVVVRPSVAFGKGGRSNGPVTYMGWVGLSAVELVMVGIMLLYGCRLLDRIKRAVVFDNRNRRAMIQRLNGVLLVMVMVLLVEMCSRCVHAAGARGFTTTMGWRGRPVDARVCGVRGWEAGPRRAAESAGR